MEPLETFFNAIPTLLLPIAVAVLLIIGVLLIMFAKTIIQFLWMLFIVYCRKAFSVIAKVQKYGLLHSVVWIVFLVMLPGSFVMYNTVDLGKLEAVKLGLFWGLLFFVCCFVIGLILDIFFPIKEEQKT